MAYVDTFDLLSEMLAEVMPSLTPTPPTVPPTAELYLRRVRQQGGADARNMSDEQLLARLAKSIELDLAMQLEAQALLEQWC
jgi:hypothetical protein